MTKQLVHVGRRANYLKKKRLAVQRKLPIILGDCSGSMGYTPSEGTEAKIDAMRRALHMATSKHPLCRVIGFSGRGVDTFTRERLYDMRAEGGTPMHRALQFAHNMKPTRVILITDGQPTDSSTSDILLWATHYAEYPIDTVATDGADDEFLEALADITGGEFKRIDDLTGLLENHIIHLIEHKDEKGGVIHV